MSKIYRFFLILDTLLIFSYYKVRGKNIQAMSVLFENFMNLGGLYVKFLQLIAVREDFLTSKYASLKDILAVFDDAKLEQISVEKEIHKQLGKKAYEIQSFEAEPFAQGSFSQVYNAQLQNGDNVILKILRPSLRENLTFDLRLLRFASRVISIFRSGDFIDAKNLFRELEDMTMQETDLFHEASVADEMYRHYVNDEMLIIPKTYLSLSTKTFLVQEKLEGVHLTEVLKQPQKTEYVRANLGSDLNILMEKLAFESLDANLSGRTSHGDPHPGNIILLPNNRVALIDFGIYGIEVERKGELVSFLEEYVHMYEGNFRADMYTQKLVRFFVPELVQALQNISSSVNEDVEKQVTDTLGLIVNETITSSPNIETAQRLIEANQPLKLFIQVINRKNRFAVQADLESMVLMRSTNMYLNLLARLDMDRSAVKGAFSKIIDKYGYLRTTIGSEYGAQSLDESYHVLSSWLDRMRYSDPVSYSRLQRALA